MAENRIAAKLDLKLMENGLIDPEFKNDYRKVHARLNSHVRKTGKILTEETFEKGDEELRKWLTELYRKGASQEKLTGYLRCGLAHLCCDFIESTYQYISVDDLVTRTIQSFKKRNYHKSYFRAAASQLADVPVKKAVKKKAAVKKTAKKKTASKKKAAGKKTSSVKTAPKKAASKKAPKKVITKKTSPKKTAPKKTAVGKTSKKAVVKKAITKKAVQKAPAGENETVKKAAPKAAVKKKPADRKVTKGVAGAKEFINRLLEKALKKK